MTILTRRYSLSMVHLIPEDYVGKDCSRLHGHDFKLEVSLAGDPSPDTGQICDRERLDSAVQEHILAPFDKKLINERLSHGTGEVLACEFFKRLRASELGSTVVGVQIVETRNNRFQCLGMSPVLST